MAIEQELTTRLKEAMRSKNQRELSVLRMVKTQGQSVKTAPGFSGEIDDAFWVDVIGKYVKQQSKALVEFEAAGDAGREQAEQIRFEVEYLQPFLPQKLGEDAVRALVEEAIAQTGAVGANMVGRVVGAIMKSHKDEVEAALVKKIASELLG